VGIKTGTIPGISGGILAMQEHRYSVMHPSETATSAGYHNPSGYLSVKSPQNQDMPVLYAGKHRASHSSSNNPIQNFQPNLGAAPHSRYVVYANEQEGLDAMK